jgi:GTP-binding protein
VSGFVDEAQLNVRGGDGGAGCVSFRRESHVPRGGPDGGDGGHGGNVWLVADRNVASLLAFRDHPHRRATSGVHGMGKKRHGHAGTDLEIHVPEGTVVYDLEGNLLADLVNPGDRWLGAQGGQGGRGNAKFLSNQRRAPSFAEQGEAGEERWLNLELKLMADVALVGFPNVGKSTLISRISAAKPRIADYPFTTLEPNLGVVRLDAATEYVVADIPGLVEGASEGRGLGHQFLRHIERARVLAILLDFAPVAERAPDEQLRVLLDELGRYRPSLLERPRLLVGSRSDLVDGSTDLDVAAWADGGTDDEARVVVSAVTGDGLSRLTGLLSDLVKGARHAEPVEQGFVVHRPAAEGVRIERVDERTWRVVGRAAERAVSLSDVTTPDAQQYVQHRLKTLGVDKALARAGLGEGDSVQIGSFAFDYFPDGDRR